MQVTDGAVEIFGLQLDGDVTSVVDIVELKIFQILIEVLSGRVGWFSGTTIVAT